VYDAHLLIQAVEELHRRHHAEADAGDSGLGDFGDVLVPWFVDRGRTVAHAMPGYWRDLGQPHHYLAAHQDLLTADQGLFDDPRWPIMTRQPQRVPARVVAGGRVEESLLSPGVRVFGEVVRSVLGPGVVVEKGAVVRNSVVFMDSVIGAGAQVDWAIVDEGCRVEPDAVVGSPDADGTSDSDAVTIIGRESVVSQDLDQGARLEPGTT
jgi:glucose-1-phosphate adenylyltransferase